MITVKAIPLLIESSDVDVNKYNRIFEEVLVGGYDYTISELEDMGAEIFEDMISLRALGDDLMIKDSEEEREDERLDFMEAHPHATEEEIDEYMEMVDEELSYSRSYCMDYYDEEILTAAQDLGYCLISSLDVTWGDKKNPHVAEITVFNCPQRSLFSVKPDSPINMEFVEIFGERT